MEKTKFSFVAAAMLLALAQLASATTYVIQPTLHYNASSGTLSIEMPAANSVALAYGANVVFALDSMTVSGVTLSNSVNTSSSSSAIVVSAPAYPSHVTELLQNGEKNVTVNNVTIVAPASVSVNFSISPTLQRQIKTLNPKPNVTVSVTVNASQKLNRHVTLEPGQNFTNSSYNFSADAVALQRLNGSVMLGYNKTYTLPKGNYSVDNLTVHANATLCSIDKNASFAYNSIYAYVNNTAPCNVSFAARVQKLNSHVSLGPGQNASLSQLNFSVTAWSANQLFRNDTLMRQLYNSTASYGCASGAVETIGAGTPNAIDICTRLRNSSAPDIFAIVSNLDFDSGNFSQSVGQAVMNSWSIATASGNNWEYQYNQSVAAHRKDNATLWGPPLSATVANAFKSEYPAPPSINATILDLNNTETRLASSNSGEDGAIIAVVVMLIIIGFGRAVSWKANRDRSRVLMGQMDAGKKGGS
jgi:hypothetical protein